MGCYPLSEKIGSGKLDRTAHAGLVIPRQIFGFSRQGCLLFRRNDRLDAERSDLKMLSDQFLAQTSGKKPINDSPAAKDQSIALAARLTALQDAMARNRLDNAEIAERLKETQAQMAQDNASVVEQLKALTQMVRDNASAAKKLEGSHEHMASAFAKDSDQSLRPQTPLPQPSATPAIPKRRNVMRNWF